VSALAFDGFLYLRYFVMVLFIVLDGALTLGIYVHADIMSKGLVLTLF
jgi:hypothetical protein